MTKESIKHNLVFIFCFYILLLSSCMKESLKCVWEDDEAEEELLFIALETKSGSGLMSSGEYTSTTYRAQLFYRGNDINNFSRQDSLITPYTGSYCDPRGTNTWLTPCAVDANYMYDSSAATPESSAYGLRAGRYHDYYMFLNSPASEYVKYGETTKYHPATGVGYTMEYWGLPYFRGGEAKDHPAVSPEIKITTKGLTVQGSYLYSVNDTLTEYRSRIAFSVRCGDAIDHANFKKLEIKGLRKNAIFRPFSQDFFFVDSLENYEDVTVYESTLPAGIRLDRSGSSISDYAPGPSQSLTGPTINAHLADNRDNTYFTYLLSGDYKTLDAFNKYVNKPAELHITLSGDDGSPINIDPIPLAFIYDPQKSYYYLITINSVYLSIDVVAQSWNTPIINDVSIDEPESWTITIGISDWTSKVPPSEQNQEINPGIGGDDAPRYDKSTGGILPGDWNTPSGGSSTVDND